MASVPTKDNVWSFAVEYFRLFRSGLRNTALRTPPAASQYNAKLSTMREAMVPDVVFNAGRGVEALLKNWMCVSLRLEDVEVELDEIKKGPADSLLASSTTSVTIQGRALRSVFPHLCVDNVDPPLARKLLGQRIHMNSWTRFEWDSTVGKVTSVTSTTDLLTPMLQLVGSVENVSRVFEGALISPNFEWRSCINPPWRPQL
ncbi:hypothetical protein JG688_00017049 [Phytophthora aleatoria]|uniref:Uncharacterized protein n=1 Tax=Phytophthora aleatoria TaxID=2496075 RepID=A0A8J5ID42_9STRA|nr:hypothetical protein JG688_00017049 [Phytophthora aleatoria]